MKNSIAALLTAFGFLVGFTVMNVYAQNTTSTSEQFGESGANMITSITSIIIAIVGLVTVLVKSGILDKRIGSVAVMVGDTAVAVKDTRQEIKDGLQNTHETIKLTSPELADQIDRKVKPAMDSITERVDEYTPKVDKFTEIAKRIGTKHGDTIEEMKDEIPNSVVSS